MSFVTLLAQRCTVYRASAGTKRYGLPDEETWTAVLNNVKCRADFSFRFGSRLEKVSEEYVGRNHGMLFVQKSSLLKARDIIVFSIPAGFIEGEQYDIEIVDPVLDGKSLHHYECIISIRDNPVALPVEEEPEEP